MSYRAHFPQIYAADAPALIRAYVPLIGTREVPGPGNNPVIMAWVTEVEKALGVEIDMPGDKTPWCGLGMAVAAVRANWADQTPKAPLWARNWLQFGRKADKPSFGDILVFRRGDRFGHVGVYVAEGPGVFHVLGANQGDTVSIVPIVKSRLLGARRPRWRVAQPATVQPIVTNLRGVVSTNEA